jgi:hypothetical protein
MVHLTARTFPHIRSIRGGMDKKQRGQLTFDKKSQGVVYGQKTRTPHLMRSSLIIVRP